MTNEKNGPHEGDRSSHPYRTDPFDLAEEAANLAATMRQQLIDARTAEIEQAIQDHMAALDDKMPMARQALAGDDLGLKASAVRFIERTMHRVVALRDLRTINRELGPVSREQIDGLR